MFKIINVHSWVLLELSRIKLRNMPSYLFFFALQVSHALAKKLLDHKVYFKHIQYFLIQLIVNFSSHVSLARILTNLDAQKDKYLTP